MCFCAVAWRWLSLSKHILQAFFFFSVSLLVLEIAVLYLDLGFPCYPCIPLTTQLYKHGKNIAQYKKMLFDCVARFFSPLHFHKLFVSLVSIL